MESNAQCDADGLKQRPAKDVLELEHSRIMVTTLQKRADAKQATLLHAEQGNDLQNAWGGVLDEVGDRNG